MPLRVTLSSKVSKDEVKADTGLGRDSPPDPKIQPVPTPETNATSSQNPVSGPTAACEDVPPSGGSSSALQPETCDEQSVAQAGAGLKPEETSSTPLSWEINKTHEDDGIECDGIECDGIESGPVSEPKGEAESRDLTAGAVTGKQSSDIYW